MPSYPKIQSVRILKLSGCGNDLGQSQGRESGLCCRILWPKGFPLSYVKWNMAMCRSLAKAQMVRFRSA